jgi:hypothetical protein
MEPPKNPSHIRTRDLKGMESSDCAVNADENVNVFL